MKMNDAEGGTLWETCQACGKGGCMCTGVTHDPGGEGELHSIMCPACLIEHNRQREADVRRRILFLCVYHAACMKHIDPLRSVPKEIVHKMVGFVPVRSFLYMRTPHLEAIRIIGNLKQLEQTGIQEHPNTLEADLFVLCSLGYAQEYQREFIASRRRGHVKRK